MRKYACILAAGAMSFGACADEGTTADNGLTGPKLNIDLAALELTGVEDAVWDLNVSTPSDTVWTARITSQQYGDGVASASYIGTCDASFEENNVTVELIGIYGSPVTAVGSFGDTPAPSTLSGNDTNPLTINNPGKMTKEFACRENEDTFVQFDVAIMRPANQGFFDIAVNFNDIYCSAKYDCDAGSLLHDGNGTRARTHVLGFACTAGASDDVDTQLVLDENVTVVCNGTTVGAIDTASADGNVCGSAGSSNNSGTAASDCDEDSVVSSPLFQAAVYKGAEQLSGLSKYYYNVALGFETDHDLSGCTLQFHATADDANAAALDGTDIRAEQVYPYVDFNVTLDSCSGNIGLDDDDNVSTQYTTTTGNGYNFSTLFPGTGDAQN